MYFDGYEEFDPVIQWSNFGDNPASASPRTTSPPGEPHREGMLR